jgi:hypothetical protein
MSHHCPSCKRVLYNRRLKLCGFCGAAIPEELQFTPEEIAKLDQKMAAWQARLKQRQQAREAARAAAKAKTAAVFPLFMP